MMDAISPIQIPKEVSPEIIAKVVFDVLFRKSLDVPDEWSRWLLLATLHILETNTAPYLDVNNLCKLQGLCQSNANYSEKETLKDDVAKENVVELKTCKVESEYPIKVEVSELGNELHIAATTRSPSEKRTHSEEYDSTGNKKLNVTKDKHVALKNTGVIRDGFNDESKPEIEKSSRPDPLLSSKESQVTPRMLHVMHNKWTQMWKKSCDKASQTENDMENESKNDIPVEKTYIHQEVQTLIPCYHDFSCQYSYTSRTEKKAQIHWKLIPLSGLPVRKGRKLSSSNLSSKGKDKKGTESEKGRDNIDMSNLCEPESQCKTDSESDGQSAVTSERPLVNIKLRKSLFHGRLMITSKSKVTTPNIPLFPIDSFLLSDPRNAEVD
ncbi:uncharacterized protein [Palaemon carinicauda]|uniref:uncharacterized protein n=1 Tax=Palaemon carinicauda TaxID=392227 RepID=UPI0035B598B7